LISQSRGLGDVYKRQTMGQIEMGLADREMVERYLTLSQAERKTIRDVVSAFVLSHAAERLP
jgi:hypothetical protein